MTDGIGWGLFVVALFVILFLVFVYKPNNDNNNATLISSLDNNNDNNNEVKCQLTDAYGRTITISGNSNDPQFQQMCRNSNNQPFYVYGYPYTFLRFNGGHHGDHGGGHGGHGGGGGGMGGHGGGGGMGK